MVSLSNTANPVNPQQVNRPEQAKNTALTWEQVVELLNKDFPGVSRLIALEFLRMIEADPNIRPNSLGLPQGLETVFALLQLGDFAVNQYQNWVTQQSAQTQSQPNTSENLRFTDIQAENIQSSTKSKAA